MTGRTNLSLRALFDHALELQGEEQAQLIASIEDGIVREKLERMLANAKREIDPLKTATERMRRTMGERFRAGDEIERWMLVRNLGTGGMGEVWLAEDKELPGRLAALKLPFINEGTTNLIRRFEREKRTLGNLSHPDIAPLLGVSSAASPTPFLAMGYADGTRLDEWLRRRDVTLEARLQLFVRVCEAVNHAHSRLIVHRDLKPANIIVRSDLSPVLLDFGIAKVLDETAGITRDTRLYTRDYASPEQIAGKPVSTATDVYGLGLILFELLTQKIALEVGTHEAPPRPAQHERALDSDLDAIVGKALAYQPDDRYASALALGVEVRNWLQGLPISATRNSWSYRLRKLIGRQKLASVITIAALLLLLTTAIGLMHQRTLALNRAEAAEAKVAFFERISHSHDEAADSQKLDEALRELAKRELSETQVSAITLDIAETLIVTQRREEAKKVLNRWLERADSNDPLRVRAQQLRSKIEAQ
jgi:eukaryotic-like serine/threonine-protein kinase